MNFVPILIVVAILAVAGFVVWSHVNSLQCVICGRTHFTESEVYRCDECGKPFCRDNAAFEERNSVLSQGRFSSASAQSSTRISFGGGGCGIVYQVISNGARKPDVHLCRLHNET
ncbi:MAG TPA: hypothetical protein PLM89_09550 [Anaerolineales bacterium]|nr:hypothetical protein [Anaerolineales bacterium]